MKPTSEQLKLLREYGERHLELMGDPDKLRNMENVLQMFEDFFRLCRQLGIPLEAQIQHVKKAWTAHITGGKDSADEIERTLRQLAALSESES